jgi:cobalt-zinc-cadmium efflux system membrane fusion protein
MYNYITIITVAVIMMACGTDKSSETIESVEALESIVQLTDTQLKNMTLVTGNLESKSISSILKVSGLIDVPPQNMISVSVPMGGFLKSTKLLPGMHISKGEVIAIMEDQQYVQLQQDYLTTEANLKFTETNFIRQKELNQNKAVSDKAFQQAEAEFLNQKIILKSLSEKLKLIGIEPEKLNENTLSRSITITSPINGYVSTVNVNIGKYIIPSDVLFELVNPEDIHLNLTVFEKDLDKLFINQKLVTYTNNHPEKKYPCEIILIGKDLSDERSVEVHCHFNSYDKFLIPGMFMNAEIEVNSKDVHTLPEDAIVRFENKNYIFAVKDKNTFEMIEVNIGNSENGFTEIKDANKFTQKIFVVKGAYTLLMKLKNKEE